MSTEDLKKQEKRKKAIPNLKIELSKIVKGITEFKRIFLTYILVLIVSVIVFGLSQFFSNVNEILSASRATSWGIITSIFAHTNISHLALDMGSLFLFIVLFTLCNSTFLLRTKKKIETFFLASVFIFAIISNILWIFFASKGTIGASGLVYAVEGVLIGFSLVNSLQILNFSKFRVQSLSTKYVVFINIVVGFGVIAQILLSPDGFLNVGQGVNTIAHTVSFQLGFFASFIWYSAIENISILN
jgi:membrane associated rhomboid family serine protease